MNQYEMEGILTVAMSADDYEEVDIVFNEGADGEAVAHDLEKDIIEMALGFGDELPAIEGEWRGEYVIRTVYDDDPIFASGFVLTKQAGKRPGTLLSKARIRYDLDLDDPDVRQVWYNCLIAS